MKLLSRNFFFVALATLLLSGCMSISPNSTQSVRLATILQPVKDSLLVTDKKPLVFPATVAVLMVPAHDSRMVPMTTLRRAAEEMKKELLKNGKYVNGVAVISPDDIGEKVTLETIHDLYGADILIILTHQQDQRFLRTGLSMIGDLVIAPSFLLPSVKVITTTAVDGKIIHIPSNAIIFRSNGYDERSAWMTPVAADRENSNDESLRGFETAVLAFGRNVSTKLGELDSFDMTKAVPLSRVLEAEATAAASKPAAAGESWAKVDSYKRSGGGAFSWLELGVGALLLGWRLRGRGASAGVTSRE